MKLWNLKYAFLMEGGNQIYRIDLKKAHKYQKMQSQMSFIFLLRSAVSGLAMLLLPLSVGR